MGRNHKMNHRINQKCHQCGHLWIADVTVELDTKAINYLNSDQETCPHCSHDSEASHDCWKCHEQENIQPEETL